MLPATFSLTRACLPGVVACCLLCSCAVGPDFVRPTAPAVTEYVHTSGTNSPVAGDISAPHWIQHADIPADWWRMFQSEQLNKLVREAIDHNATLEAANATLRQSQHNLQAGYGVFFPQLDVGLGASRVRTAPIEQGLNTPSSIYNVVTLSGTAGYTLDLFGGERRAVEGLTAAADYQRYAAKAAYITLTANVVNAGIARAAYAAQIRATQQMIELQQQQLNATRAQIRAGTAAYAAELSIQSLIAASQASLPTLQQQMVQAENLLAVLQDKLPGQASLTLPELDQISLPAEIPLTVPSELAHQRPDILQSEAQLHVASANIGVATAALFPSISLTGSVGQAGTSLGNLSGESGRFWSIGPSVSLPIFRGGTLWYERQAALDAFAAAQANYRQTVLAGFAQVATLLEALGHDASVLQAQSDARRYAQQTLLLTQTGYQSGMASWLEVMAADVQYQQASIAYIQAEAQHCQDTVALVVALGGGWWNVPETAP